MITQKECAEKVVTVNFRILSHHFPREAQKNLTKKILGQLDFNLRLKLDIPQVPTFTI
jgi:hypothetical protein